jgi:hypothetical protein
VEQAVLGLERLASATMPRAEILRRHVSSTRRPTDPVRTTSTHGSRTAEGDHRVTGTGWPREQR